MCSMFLSALVKLICLTTVFYCIESDVEERDDITDDVVDYSGSRVVRVIPKYPEQLTFLHQLNSDSRIIFWLHPTQLNAPVDIMIKPAHIKEVEMELEEIGLIAKVFINDVGSKMSAESRIQFYSSSENSFFDDFRRYKEIQEFLDKKHKENAAIVSVSSIGKSVEGRPIMVIKIGENLGSDKKQVIYIDGGMHAREWAGVSTTLYIIEHLIDDYNNGDKEVKHLLKTFDFFIVPVVNPDGYEFTHTKDRMWRKNRRVIPNSECMGTDLNRNYPFHWGGEGSSRNPCDEIFAGPKPLSEPESTAVTKLILANKKRMISYITLHAYGQYFLYPWGWTKDNSPNHKELARVGQIGYKALHAVHNTKYSVGSPGQIMYVSQGSDDWAHGEALIPYVYCLEMRDLGENGFLLPKTEIIPTGEETYAGVKAMAAAMANVKRKPNSNVSEFVRRRSAKG